MESLKDKQSKSYNYISRYSNFSIAYNTNDNKFIYELTSQLENSTEYVIHKLSKTDNLDYLSNKYYGRPDLFWIIADFNRIQDPFIILSDYFTDIKIPTLTSISYKE